VAHFLLIYDRDAGELLRKEEFPTDAQALAGRFAAEAEFVGRPEIEIVALSAESEADLRDTHARYFLGLAELADRMTYATHPKATASSGCRNRELHTRGGGTLQGNRDGQYVHCLRTDAFLPLSPEPRFRRTVGRAHVLCLPLNSGFSRSASGDVLSRLGTRSRSGAYCRRAVATGTGS